MMGLAPPSSTTPSSASASGTSLTPTPTLAPAPTPTPTSAGPSVPGSTAGGSGGQSPVRGGGGGGEYGVREARYNNNNKERERYERERERMHMQHSMRRERDVYSVRGPGGLDRVVERDSRDVRERERERDREGRERERERERDREGRERERMHLTHPHPHPLQQHPHPHGQQQQQQHPPPPPPPHPLSHPHMHMHMQQEDSQMILSAPPLPPPHWGMGFPSESQYESHPLHRREFPPYHLDDQGPPVQGQGQGLQGPQSQGQSQSQGQGPQGVGGQRGGGGPEGQGGPGAYPVPPPLSAPPDWGTHPQGGTAPLLMPTLGGLLGVVPLSQRGLEPSGATWSTLPESGDGEDDGYEDDVRAKVTVDLGTYVYPSLPFPYFFELGAGLVGQRERAEERERREKEREEREGKVRERMRMRKEKEREKERDKENPGSTSSEVVAPLIVEPPLPPPPATTTNATTNGPTTPADGQPMLDVETRTTIVIPWGHIPTRKPTRSRLWGGAAFSSSTRPPPAIKRARSGLRTAPGSRRVSPVPEDKSTSGGNPSQPTIGGGGNRESARRSRRIYTDDSDLILCAIHSGWLTWSGALRARENRLDLKLNLRVIRVAGAGPNGVFARGVGLLGVMECEGGRIRQEIIGRFVGGFGERCWWSVGRSGRVGEEEGGEDLGYSLREDPEDDGRGIVSAAWGSGHDGSAIEVVGLEFCKVRLFFFFFLLVCR